LGARDNPRGIGQFETDFAEQLACPSPPGGSLRRVALSAGQKPPLRTPAASCRRI